MGADRPEPADPPRRSPLDDLRQRLARLPATHPSGPGYDRAFAATSGHSGAWGADGPAGGPAADRGTGGPAADRGAAGGGADRGAAGGGADRDGRAAADAAGTADPDPADGSAPGAGNAPVGVRGRADKPAGPDLATLQRLDRLARVLWPNGRDRAAWAPRRAPEIRGPGGPGGRAGREPYRPWFCSGDPYQPWFSQDPDDRWY